MHKDLSNFYKNWEIYISQCYPNSLLKITELSNICQQVAALHSAAWGMSYTDMQKHHQAWVLSSMRFELFDMPKWHQTIQSETWIENLKGMRSIRNFEIKKDNQWVAKASSLWVVLNTERRRPEPLAIAYDNLQQYPDRKATSLSTSRIDLTLEAQTVGKRTVLYSDLDIVGHANNVKYMEWCLDTLDRDIIDNNRIKAIDLNYLKEIHYKDLIEIKRCEKNFFIYFYITKQDNIYFAMKLEIR